MKKKLLSVLLALVMTGSSFAMFACGESGVNGETDPSDIPSGNESVDDADAGDNTEEPVETTRESIPDELPETTFGGREFRVLTKANTAGYDYNTEIVVEEQTGEGCNDAIYNRTLKTESRFDIDILVTPDNSCQETVKKVATAGTDDYHLSSCHQYEASVPIIGQALLNWHDAPYVDLDKPWHNSLANDDATINGLLYCITSDLAVTSMTYIHAIFANTNLLKNFDYTADYLYNAVEEGTWTFDKLIEMTTGMYVDVNGNGKADNRDTFGFGYSTINPADVWFTAFGGDICTVNPNTGEIELTYMSEKTVQMFDKLYNYHYNNPGFTKLSNQYDEENYFRTDRLVMAPMRFYAAYNALRDMESEYIMIPFPKWDEAQTNYYTNADDKYTVFGIPKSVAGDIEYISIIFEALCADSYKYVYPAYYDQALKGKYSSDERTAEMVDIIVAGRAFDFSFQFPAVVFKNFAHHFRNLINDQKTDFVSDYESLEPVVLENIETIIRPAYHLD